MASLGIVQVDDPRLRRPARPVDPLEVPAIMTKLLAAMDRVAAVHDFAKGMGIAAPQIGIDAAVAIVRADDGELITLINPHVVERSVQLDEHYEGCLSFFDVRGLVPRPLRIVVRDQSGTRSFENASARLVLHEIDHLNGVLYTDHMRSGVSPIPVGVYRETGQSWKYAE